MAEIPDGVKDGATLTKEWRQDGHHCQVWSDYKYHAGVINGDVVSEQMDVGVEAVVKEMQKELDYMESGWPDGFGNESLPQEYRCPFNRNRILREDNIVEHLITRHPEKIFPEPLSDSRPNSRT